IKNAGTASATTVSASPTARALAREDAFAIGNLPIFLDAVHNRVIPSAFFASVVIKSDFNLSTCDRIQSLLPTRRTVPGAELDAAAKPMVGRNSGPTSRGGKRYRCMVHSPRLRQTAGPMGPRDRRTVSLF